MPANVSRQPGGLSPVRSAPDSGAQWSPVFTTLNDAFWLLCRGPAPLTLPGALFTPGRTRPVRLVEAQRLLLARRSGLDLDTKDQVLAELVRRAQTSAPEWIVGAAGVLLPGLAAKVNRLARGYPGDREDLEAEVLAGFLTALRTVDPDSGRLAARLCWAGYRAGLALRHRDEADRRRRATAAGAVAPRQPWGHPDFVLAAAVHAGILTVDEADLIGATRFDGVRLEQAAAERGATRAATTKRRYRAERRLVAALSSGDLTTTTLTGPPPAAAAAAAGPAAGDRRPAPRPVADGTAGEVPARRVLCEPENAVAECRTSLARPAAPADHRPDGASAGAA